MAVNDSGLEAIRKSAEEVTPGDKSNYKFKVRVDNKASEAIPVTVSSILASTAEVLNIYAEVTSVASATETTVVTYTVPALKVAEVYFAEISGGNISTFKVKVNGSKIGTKRSYWADFNQTFQFAIGVQEGLRLVATDVLIITAEHSRTATSDYEGRLLVSEDDA